LLKFSLIHHAKKKERRKSSFIYIYIYTFIENCRQHIDWHNAYVSQVLLLDVINWCDETDIHILQMKRKKVKYVDDLLFLDGHNAIFTSDL